MSAVKMFSPSGMLTASFSGIRIMTIAGRVIDNKAALRHGRQLALELCCGKARVVREGDLSQRELATKLLKLCDGVFSLPETIRMQIDTQLDRIANLPEGWGRKIMAASRQGYPMDFYAGLEDAANDVLIGTVES